jgi:hypothetical protein
MEEADMQGIWSKAALITFVAALGSVGCGGSTEEGTFGEQGKVAREEARGVSALDQDPRDKPWCEGVTASPTLLWPPNHKFHLIELDGKKHISVVMVKQDEPLDAEGDGNTSPDAMVVDGKLYLRAERSGQGDGRVYCIYFEAEDKYGEKCTGVVTVGVPHDQGQGSEPINSGCKYNSFGDGY